MREPKQEKEASVGNMVRVQLIIDYLILKELQTNGRRYGLQIHKSIIGKLDGVGVNDSYLSRRLRAMAANDHIIGKWDSDNRYNRFYTITASGVEYFHMIQKELPGKIALAVKTYTQFEKIINNQE